MAIPINTILVDNITSTEIIDTRYLSSFNGGRLETTESFSSLTDLTGTLIALPKLTTTLNKNLIASSQPMQTSNSQSLNRTNKIRTVEVTVSISGSSEESITSSTASFVSSQSTLIPTVSLRNLNMSSMQQKETSKVYIASMNISSSVVQSRNNMSEVDPTATTASIPMNTSLLFSSFNSSIPIMSQPISSVNALSKSVNATHISDSSITIASSAAYQLNASMVFPSVVPELNTTMLPITSTPSLLIKNFTYSSLSRNMTMSSTASTYSFPIENVTASSGSTINITALFTTTTTSTVSFDYVTSLVSLAPTSVLPTKTLTTVTVIPTELLHINATLDFASSTVSSKHSKSLITRHFPRSSFAPQNNTSSLLTIMNTVHSTESENIATMTTTLVEEPTPTKTLLSVSSSAPNSTSIYSVMTPSPSSSLTLVLTSSSATTIEPQPVLETHLTSIGDTTLNVRLPTPFVDWMKITVYVIIDGIGQWAKSPKKQSVGLYF